MGILESWFGLMKVEDHNRIVAKQDALIDRAAEHMKGEDFDRGTSHADRVALVMARLRASRTLAERRQAEINGLRPDAEKWRDYLKRARDRKQAKKDAANDAAPKVAKKGAR